MLWGSLEINGNEYIGGLSGEASDNEITGNLEGTSTISGGKYTGGLAGSLVASSRVSGYFSSIAGTSSITGGGLSGYTTGILTRTGGDSTNFGYIAGSNNFNLVAYRSRLVAQPILPADARGVAGTVRDITSVDDINYNDRLSGFGDLTFGNTTWRMGLGCSPAVACTKH